jgi:hypothetical protein
MLLNKSSKSGSRDPHTSGPGDDRWLLADLEAAQRRDLYAAGHGDGPRRAPRRRWGLARAKRS